MTALSVRVELPRGGPLRARLRARPDAMELVFANSSAVLANADLSRATLQRALVAPRIIITLESAIQIAGHEPLSTLRLLGLPWQRRELQRYVDEINGRVADRERFNPPSRPRSGNSGPRKY